MTAYHTVADADILTESGRGGLQCDAIVIAVGDHSSHDDLMTAVDVEGIVIVVVPVKHLDAVDAEAVASQEVLHPTTAVAQGDVLDGDIAALDKAQQVRTGDALIIPRFFLEGASPAIDGACARDGYITDGVGIDELYSGGLRA